MKFGYNAGSLWSEESALSGYKHGAKAVTPSANLYFVRPFPGLFSSLFSLIESEIPEQARRQLATEELNKGLLTCRAPYIFVSKSET